MRKKWPNEDHTSFCLDKMEDSEWQFIDYKFYIILKFDIYYEKKHSKLLSAKGLSAYSH